MIGLVDYDWFFIPSQKYFVPNLEIMKLATYFSKEKQQFCRLMTLDEEDLNKYEIIYFISEFASSVTIPPSFLRASNVKYKGANFTNQKYIPFEDSLIDFTIPRIDIYKNFLKEKYQDGTKASVISNILDNAYYRMKAGNEILPIPPMMARKKIFIFDTDFFIPELNDILDQIESRRPASIIPLHPIRCNNLSNYFLIRNRRSISRATEIILDLKISVQDFQYLLKKYSKILLADITSTSNVFIPIGGQFESNFQCFKDYLYKMNLLYTFWSANIPIKMKYEPPQIGYINCLSNLEQYTAIWTRGTRPDLSLNERFSKGLNKGLRQLLSEEKKLLLKFYPEAKDLFNQSHNDIIKRRYWRV